MRLLRQFSIGKRSLFGALVFGLALFCFGTYWSVRAAIEADMRSKLEGEADRIVILFRDRLELHANTLLQMKAHFHARGVPDEETFTRLVSQLELEKQFPGLHALAWASLAGSDEDQLRAHVDLVAPPARKDLAAFDLNILRLPEQRKAMEEAASNSRPIMSEPLSLSTDPSRESRKGLVLYLPVALDNGSKPSDSISMTNAETTTGEPSKTSPQMSGVVLAALSARELFDGILGFPSLKSETVNFKVKFVSTSNGLAAGSTDGKTHELVLYDRFDAHDETSTPFAVQTRVEMFGRTILLEVTPLPHFFTRFHRFLPLIVGFCAAFISVLIVVVLKASQAQIISETQAKELSLEAARRSRTQQALLKRANVIARAISGELDLDALTERFVDLLLDFSQANAAAFWFSPRPVEESKINLIHRRALAADEIANSSLPLHECLAWFSNRLAARASDHDADLLIERLVKNGTKKFSDWILLPIPSRQTGSCGLLLLSRTDGKHFGDNRTEFTEGLIAQAASSIENATLFRRVEEASRAKNAFLANMSHEIRTPLNAIIGFSEMMTRKDLSTGERAQLSMNLRKSGQQLTRLIDDVLDLSRIEADKLIIERRRVKLASLLQDVQSVIDLSAREKMIDFSIECSGALPTHIATDEVRIKQVLLNLIGNAIKFTERGSVLLHVRIAHDALKGDRIVFRVKDSGVGMSAEAQQQLFQPFQQGDASTTRRYGGSGLGLVLSQRLCREMGGDLILVESTPERGSTFEAWVETGPLLDTEWTEDIMRPSVTDEMPSDDVVPGLSSTRILLVEDSIDNQEIFRFFLEAAGSDVDIVENGLQAVSKGLAGNYDVILMDIQIPEIDGKEATRRLRRHGYAGPIIALTAHAMSEEKKSCLAAGCDGQITKPVSGDALVREVAHYLRRTNATIAAGHA